MSSTYTRSLSGDFGGNLNIQHLITLIQTDPGITTELSMILTDGDVITITFQSTLSGSEDTALVNILDNYVYKAKYSGDTSNAIDTTDPTVNEDIARGFNVGSRWFNTVTQRHYLLRDATIGAAVWDEFIISKKCDIYHNPSSSQTIGSNWTDISLNNVRVKDDIYTHLSDSAEITVTQDGNYELIARCTTKLQNSNKKTQLQMRLALDSGSGFNSIPGSFGLIYNNNKTLGINTSSVNVTLQLSTGDKIKMQAIRISGNGNVVTVPEACSFKINRG